MEAQELNAGKGRNMTALLHSLTVNSVLSGNFLVARKMSFKGRTMIPGFDDVPTIVCVFPEPVAP